MCRRRRVEGDAATSQGMLRASRSWKKKAQIPFQRGVCPANTLSLAFLASKTVRENISAQQPRKRIQSPFPLTIDGNLRDMRKVTETEYLDFCNEFDKTITPWWEKLDKQLYLSPGLNFEWDKCSLRENTGQWNPTVFHQNVKFLERKQFAPFVQCCILMPKTAWKVHTAGLHFSNSAHS